MTYQSEALRLAKLGVLTAAQARQRGITAAALARLEASGHLLRMARGVYLHPQAQVSQWVGLAVASARCPRGAICLLSALAFHGLSDALPGRVWLAYRRGDPRPQAPELGAELAAFSRESFDHGVRRHRIDGVEVPITGPAKAVADCFKFRSRVGLELCLGALGDYLGRPGRDIARLERAARVCRVWPLMRPYLQALA